jgi:hypothetical protein
MHTRQPNAACIVYQELALTVVDNMQCCQAFLPCWMLLSPAMADIQSSGQSGRCGGSLWSCKVAFALKRGHGQMTLVQQCCLSTLAAAAYHYCATGDATLATPVGGANVHQ